MPLSYICNELRASREGVLRRDQYPFADGTLSAANGAIGHVNLPMEYFAVCLWDHLHRASHPPESPCGQCILVDLRWDALDLYGYDKQ